MKEIRCHSCHSPHIALIGNIAASNTFAGRRLERPLKGGNLYRCLRCHLYFRDPRLSSHELNELYLSGNERSWASAPSQRKDWHLIREWLISKKKIHRVVDIGCFDGRLLKYLGSGYCCLGIELHKEAASRARANGVQVVGNDFFNMPILHPPADVAIAVDVIEHSPDPSAFLAAAASCVRPGGYVVISTGNTEALTWRLMGSRYWYCHIAEHLSFINPSWARFVAPQLGLEIQQIKPFSHAEGRTNLKHRLYEASGNLLLRVAPELFVKLRRCGFGEIDQRHFPDLALTPPYWMSAADHILVIFRKCPRA